MLYSICFNKNQLEKVFKDKLLSQIDSNTMCCTSCQRNENIHIFTYRILPKIIWRGGSQGVRAHFLDEFWKFRKWRGVSQGVRRGFAAIWLIHTILEKTTVCGSTYKDFCENISLQVKIRNIWAPNQTPIYHSPYEIRSKLMKWDQNLLSFFPK